MKAVCKDCERRTVGCHSTCEDYITWRREKDERNEKVYRARYADKELAGTKWTPTRRKRVKHHG